MAWVCFLLSEFGRLPDNLTVNFAALFGSLQSLEVSFAIKDGCVEAIGQEMEASSSFAAFPVLALQPLPNGLVSLVLAQGLACNGSYPLIVVDFG
ncbi:hypothetical protein U1Q18_039674 [Sarracenia purpurea var. burkii]